jgi:hypothetical protein
MKSMVLIPLSVSITALVLRIAGLRFAVTDPLSAAVIAAVAGTLGILPILRTRQKDAVTIVQRALVGTVLHLLATAVLAVALVASHLVNPRGPFVFWLLGAYWISLAVLVWQLRRVMLEMTGTLKVQN